MDDFARANDLMVEDSHAEALEAYSAAIAAEPTNAAYLLKRSICHSKMGNHVDAVADADASAQHAGEAKAEAKALQRKATALFALEEYESALKTFNRVEEVDPSVKIDLWRRKCVAELEESGVDVSGMVPPKKKKEPKPEPVDPATAAAAQAFAERQRDKIFRDEWYQNPTHVFVTVFAKKIKQEDLQVEIAAREIDIRIKLPSGSEYVLNHDLCGEILPAESSYQLMSTKVELKLKKKEPAAWATLEAKEDAIALQQPAAATSAAGDMRNPFRKDWDSIDKAIEKELEDEPKGSGDEALNKLLKQIYGDGSEEQRRAMNKSFVESGGTVLSTNWSEVGTKKVEGQAPDGMEMKKYEN